SLNSEIKGNGKLFIKTTNVDSALIFVDNSFTNKYTPDTITISEGLHIIELKKNGYSTYSHQVSITANKTDSLSCSLERQQNRVVLIEEFSNVSCATCPETNKILESFAGEYAGNLTIIKYSAYYPSRNDPFYMANQANCDAMLSYYNILSTPTVIVDGKTNPTPRDSIKIKEAIQQELVKISQFDISIKDSLAGNDYFVFVNVTNTDQSGISFDNLVLKTVLLEKEVEFTTPPGQNGELKFYNVCRAMMPSSSGQNIPEIKGKSKVYTLQFSLNSSWNRNMLKCVAFIQDKNTKVVYQASFSK
ncbi:MAG: Omp28-related outer membrane protein, partial [Bacteroidota bacterium]|nr:Omp28-related outer membrane protein [Bacteroidota bacterium]